MCRVTMAYLRVTIGHLGVTIGHLRATMGHLRLTSIGYLKATGNIRSPLGNFTANISCKFRWQKEHRPSPSWLNVQDRPFHLLSVPKNAPVCARVTTAGWPGPAAATGVTATATTTLQSPAGSRRGPWRPSLPSSASGGRRTGSTPPRSSRHTSELAPSQSLIASI